MATMQSNTEVTNDIDIVFSLSAQSFTVDPWHELLI